MEKELFSFAAIALTFISYVPYIRSIMTGQTKPHVFSWIIWSAATLIIFAATLSEGGGAGAWPIGVTGLICCYVTWLAYHKRGEITITSMDWIFFIMSIASLPLWYFTSDPLWTVAVLTTIDLLGFGPTFRKSYHQPYSEPLHFYAVTVARSALTIAALEQYTATTLLLPVSITVQCIIFVIMVWSRRRQLAKTRAV